MELALVGRLRAVGFALLAALGACAPKDAPPTSELRLLYVASPGIRNEVVWGGKGVLVYDIDRGHAFVRRIASPFDDPGGVVENVKGIAASAVSRRLYVSTIRRLAAMDLLTDQWLWVRSYEGGCDRMAITPDGRKLYVPSLDGPHWNVVDGETGAVLETLVTNQGSHNTVISLDGRRVFFAGLRSRKLLIVDTGSDEEGRQVQSEKLLEIDFSDGVPVRAGDQFGVGRLER
jgi:DNA-binding beta-propeller fold protein YncE